MRELMFVESPAKIKSISKYLEGRDLRVFATYGHIRELSRGWSNIGDDILKSIKWVNVDRKIDYSNRKIPIIEAIKKEASLASKIYLSTDPDREGEAISWHIYSILSKENQKKCSRAVFNEITESAIKYSLEHTRQLDQAQINSYLARVLLDKLIGFNLSSYVRKKVGGLSAGRVQSIALKFLADKEEEIKAFQPKNWFILKVQLDNGLWISLCKLSSLSESQFELSPHGHKGYVNFKTKEDLEKFLVHLDDYYWLAEISETKVEHSNPPEVFKTSSLFETAINKLGVKSEDVRRTVQKLYEGIPLGTETVSLISYPRTDRTSLSEEFVQEIKTFISSNYEKQYWVNEADLKKRDIKKKKDLFTQGAHEGIRPTNIEMTPRELSNWIQESSLEYKIYNLIWSYTVSSFLPPSKNEKRRYNFTNQGNIFFATENNEIFDGYKSILRNNGLMEFPEKPEFDFRILKEKEEYLSKQYNIAEERNSPPAKYSEASLIKALENKGIGRPSTYPLISEIIRSRNYANFKNRKFEITELGYKVSKDLDKNFSSFISYDYTRSMEEELDNISKSKTDWKEFLESVAETWKKEYSKAEHSEIVENKLCPECNSPCVYKFSRKSANKFIGCTDYPRCTFVERIEQDKSDQELLDKQCPQCNGQLINKKNKWGNFFVACSNFPKCKYIETSNREIEVIEGSFCPDCKGQLVYKNSLRRKGVKFISCSNYPKCKYSASASGERRNNNFSSNRKKKFYKKKYS